MAIKKALYGRQPGCFYLRFSLSPLAVPRYFVFSLGSGIFNKVPSFTHFGLKRLLIVFEDFIPAQILEDVISSQEEVKEVRASPSGASN